MGMGTKKKGKSGGSGMGKKKEKSSAPKFDVSNALKRSEKRYDELQVETAKALQASDDDDKSEFISVEEDVEVITEYVVAARAKPSASAAPKAASDWIPVCQICVVRPVHRGRMKEAPTSIPPFAPLCRTTAGKLITSRATRLHRHLSLCHVIW